MPRESEKQEKNMINLHVREPLYERRLEKSEENMVNSDVLEPLHAWEPEKRGGNIFHSPAVEPLYAEGLEKREENMINSDVLEPLHAWEPEKRGGNIFYSEVVEPLYAEGLEKQEENVVYPYELKSYAEQPENTGDNIFYSQAVEPLYAGGLEKREESIVYPCMLNESSYIGQPENRGNIFNPQAVELLYVGIPGKREESMVYPNVPMPLYAGIPGVIDMNIINCSVLVPMCAGRQERREETIVYPNVPIPSYSRGPEKREESMVYPTYPNVWSILPMPLYAGEPNVNMINCFVLVPVYLGEPEKREENLVYPGFAPSYTMGPEERGGNMLKPNVSAPSCAGRLEKREENVINPYAINPLHVGGAEERVENMIERLSLSNDVTKLEYSFNKYYNTLNINEENNLIKQRFMDKQKDPTYKEMQKVRKKLPVWSQKNEILEAIHKNQVVIISGETGCGKSTQIPQFVLDDWIINIQRIDNSHINIICTQPRKISTIVLAERIAAERIENIGETIGYHVRLEKKLSSKTRVTFCTIGILLQELMGNLNLTNITHVIIDEVHERSVESDYLLMILKDLLPKRSSLKIILMSTTINAEVFSSYFEHAPVLNIPGTFFSVKQIFLEDVLEETGYILHENSKYICTHKKRKSHTDLNIEMKGTIRVDCIAKKFTKDEDLTMAQLINRYPNRCRQTHNNLYLMNYNKINYDLIEHILVWIITGEHNYPKKGSILIFLPGLYEIITLMEQLKRNFILSRNKIMIFPLHSNFSTEEQSRVFQKTEGVRKVVISTNLAETSITIDDCAFVIDSGRMKESKFNLDQNVNCLETCWVTQANVVQRKGRAGRVTFGVCIHLYTSHRYEHFAARPIPEILKVSLEWLFLHIALMHGGRKIDMYAITQRMLDPPSPHQVASTIKRLQDVDAFDLECKLTAFGHYLAKLPVNIGIGKLILCGVIFCCLDSVLTIAACMSHKSPFSVPFESKERVDPRMKFFKENSDHLTILQAYREWQNITYKKGKKAGKEFAKENFMSVHTLYTLVGLKYQFLEVLVSNGFVNIDLSKRQPDIDNIFIITGNELNKNNSNNKLLQGLICAALYPNIAKVKEDQTNAFDLPSNTVFETQDGDFVKIHPSSVNFHPNSAKFFSSHFLAYQKKLKTSKVFILEVSMIPLLAVVLFSDLANFQNSPDGNFIISLNHNWFKFRVVANQGHYLASLRKNLAILLTDKMRNPLSDFTKDQENQKIIDTIVHAVTNHTLIL